MERVFDLKADGSGDFRLHRRPWRLQCGDSLHDRSEEFSWDRDFRRPEGDIATVADDLCAGLDQLLAQARERPVLDRFWGRKCA